MTRCRRYVGISAGRRPGWAVYPQSEASEVTSSPTLNGQGFLLHQFGLLNNFCYPVETNPSQAHPHSPWVWFLLTRSSSLVSISPFWALRHLPYRHQAYWHSSLWQSQELPGSSRVKSCDVGAFKAQRCDLQQQVL